MKQSVLYLCGLIFAGVACASTPATTPPPGWQSLGTQPLDANTNKIASNPSMALDSSGNPVVTWSESDGTSINIYVKRWTGSTWNLVGGSFLDINTSQAAANPSVTLDSSGNPVVTWSESDGASFNIYVKRWSGNAWNLVGSGFLDVNIDKDASKPSLALDKSGNPVVSWSENDANLTNIYVKRWSRSAWDLVGSTFLDVNSNKDASSPALVLDKNGSPTVVWEESDGSSTNIYAKRYNPTP